MTDSAPSVDGVAPWGGRLLARPMGVDRLARAALAAGFLAVVTAVCHGAHAGADVFTVSGIRVDQTAGTAAAAREKALSAGQKEALERLLQRIVLGSDVDNLPVLSRSDVTELVRDFEIVDEKTSSVRYLGVIDVRFKPDEVRAFLRGHGVAFAETASRPVLVLPVYEVAGAYSLWDDPNPWREAWIALPPSDGLVPLIRPNGDLRDASLIGAEQALLGDETSASMIARRYGAGSVLVVVAGFGTGGRAPGDEGGPVLHVTLGRIGAARFDQSHVESFRLRDGEDRQALLERAASSVAFFVQERWKRENRLRFDASNRVEVTVPLASLSDWLEIRRRLADIALIRASDLVYLSRKEARLRIDFIGDAEQLTLALVQNDLILERRPLTWVLRRSGGQEESDAEAQWRLEGREPEGERPWPEKNQQ